MMEEEYDDKATKEVAYQNLIGLEIENFIKDIPARLTFLVHSKEG
ncbi:hypothetical protein [Vibrio sp. B1REV9]|nr:hypothetical protein [Vibrio sp. B1REV9]